ncbi:hypothetical protein PR048_001632 [Dryococelus australis]|uniref:Uncharacterized protein n=1 Tax=Dryococelus australis TaxID=614101 RepID=A0ABQ9IKC4_9NEOP|nr:hypothetical protein PR048_001632 [Dryococelus australis]
MLNDLTANLPMGLQIFPNLCARFIYNLKPTGVIFTPYCCYPLYLALRIEFLSYRNRELVLVQQVKLTFHHTGLISTPDYSPLIAAASGID